MHHCQQRVGIVVEILAFLREVKNPTPDICVCSIIKKKKNNASLQCKNAIDKLDLYVYHLIQEFNLEILYTQ